MPGTSFSTSNWGSYDEHSADISPSGALTDFSLLIDISNLSASFGSTVQSDGGDIRCTDENDTELAFDLIDWNYGGGSPTGFIRVKRSLSTSTSTQKVRVWYDYTPGTAIAYDSNETYGSDNAYDANWAAYWPLGGGTDRTSNGNDTGLMQGSSPSSFGSVTGKIGSATRYVESNGNFADAPDDATLNPSSVSLVAQVNHDGWASPLAAQWYLCKSPNANFYDYSLLDDNGDLQSYLENNGNANRTILDIASPGKVTGVDRFAAVSYDDATNNFFGYYNGTATSPVTHAPSLANTSSPVRLGAISHTGVPAGDQFLDGVMENVQVHSVARSTDWFAQEYNQTNDNATFWGTWTSNSSGGGGPTTTFTPKIMIWT